MDGDNLINLMSVWKEVFLLFILFSSYKQHSTIYLFIEFYLC